MNAIDPNRSGKTHRDLGSRCADLRRRLEVAEKRVQGVFHLTTEAIFIVRLDDGRILAVNPAFEALSGYTSKELVGKKIGALGLWESAEDGRRLRENLTAHGRLRNETIRFCTKNRQQIEAVVSATSLTPEAPDQIMVAVRDMGPAHTTSSILRGHRQALQLQNDWLQRVQADLQTSRRLYQDLFESAPVGYCTLDRSGVILSVNRTGAKMLAQSPEAISGNSFFDWITEDYQALMVDHLDRVFAEETRIGCEIKLKPIHGRQRFLRLISKAVQDGDGQIRNCRTAFLDDTERRRAQASLGIANRFLSIANRLKDVDSTLQDFLDEMKRSTDCEALGIRMLTGGGKLPLTLSVGFPGRFRNTEKRLCGRTKACLCDKVIAREFEPALPFFTSSGAFFTQQLSNSIPLILEMENTQPNGTCAQMGFETLAIIPIRAGDAVLGLIIAADSRPEALDFEGLNLLENAALQLGNSIRRAHIEEALRRSHEELEERVAARTAEVVETNTRLQEQIDRRERAERRLRQSREMLQQVFDGISDPLVLTDGEMRIRMINRAAQKYYGLASTSDIAGLHCQSVLAKKIDACRGCPIPAAVAKGRAVDFERPGFRDPTRMEKVVIYPLEEPEGRPKGAVIRIQDITEEKSMERHLIQNEKLASLGTLISSVAHEINNPNSFISFNMPILRDYLNALLPIADGQAAAEADLELYHMPYAEFRADLLRMIDNIEHGSQRINAFLSNLREFSAARPSIELKPMSLGPLLDKAITLVGTKLRKTVKTVDVDLPEGLPPVVTDESALEQVLVNLLVNAAQAADKPDAWIRLQARSENGDAIRLEVADNGCGMSAAVQAKIFDPFFSTKINEGGTGLGLYVCRKLVREIGGRLELESRPGEGSRFTVTLPEQKTLLDK